MKTTTYNWQKPPNSTALAKEWREEGTPLHSICTVLEQNHHWSKSRPVTRSGGYFDSIRWIIWFIPCMPKFPLCLEQLNFGWSEMISSSCISTLLFTVTSTHLLSTGLMSKVIIFLTLTGVFHIASWFKWQQIKMTSKIKTKTRFTLKL